MKQGVFTVPGDGAYDFLPAFEILAKSNYKGWLLVEAEQDPIKQIHFNMLSSQEIIYEIKQVFKTINSLNYNYNIILSIKYDKIIL